MSGPAATTATGRPVQRVPLFPRLGAVLLLGVALLELLRLPPGGPGVPQVLRVAAPVLHRYESLRAWVFAHPALALAGAGGAVALLVLLARAVLLLWHNQVVARLSGTYLTRRDYAWPARPVDLLAEVARRPPGHWFLGLEPQHGLFGWRYRPVYLSPAERARHRHVLGRSGSGKTRSVLLPMLLQDVLDGYGLFFADPKGSEENLRAVAGVAALAGRQSQLRVFRLPAWSQGGGGTKLFSHTYNMVYVRPRAPGDSGGDPISMAERVFSALTLGDNDYYNTQALTMLTSLSRLLHGMVDERGHGLPFVRADLVVCLKGIGTRDAWATALDHCLAQSVEREAALEVQSQIERLGRDAAKCFTGLIAALDKLASPLVDAYAPDILFEEVVEQGLLVYAQLPANLYKVQAPALGKLMLLDLQQQGSLRQVYRERSQAPFTVMVDEYADFADSTFVSSLNKLRDASFQIAVAHQSPADLRRISAEFAEAVWDNTPLKFVLHQDSPVLAEMLAKSIGTESQVELTVRRQQGALMTSLTTGDASSRLVEAYRLHPNQIKGLAGAGQGYFYDGKTPRPLAFGMFPEELVADVELPRKDQSKARGLRLYERFVKARDA